MKKAWLCLWSVACLKYLSTSVHISLVPWKGSRTFEFTNCRQNVWMTNEVGGRKNVAACATKKIAIYSKGNNRNAHPIMLIKNATVRRILTSSPKFLAIENEIRRTHAPTQLCVTQFFFSSFAFTHISAKLANFFLLALHAYTNYFLV